MTFWTSKTSILAISCTTKHLFLVLQYVIFNIIVVKMLCLVQFFKFSISQSFVLLRKQKLIVDSHKRLKVNIISYRDALWQHCNKLFLLVQ